MGYIGIIYNALVIIRNTQGVSVINKAGEKVDETKNSTFIYNIQGFLLLLKFLLSIMIPPLPNWLYQRLMNEKITSEKIKKDHSKMLVDLGKEIGGIGKRGKLDKNVFESKENKSLKYFFKNKEKVEEFMGVDLNDEKPFVKVNK